MPVNATAIISNKKEKKIIIMNNRAILKEKSEQKIIIHIYFEIYARNTKERTQKCSNNNNNNKTTKLIYNLWVFL